MGASTGDFSREPVDSLGDTVENKRLAHTLPQLGQPSVDADLIMTYMALFRSMRRLQQTFFGDGSPSGNTGFQIVGTGANNDFTVKGGDGTLDGAGRLWVSGIPLFLLDDTTFLNVGGSFEDKYIFPVSTGLTNTVLTDSAADYVVNELVGRQLVPNIEDGTAYTISANTATSITVTGTMLATASVGDHYRVNMRTPSGSDRTDTVWLNVYMDEIDADEDSDLEHSIPPLADFVADLRATIQATVFVQEGDAARANYTDADDRDHYMLLLATIERTDGVAAIAAGDVTDNRPIITSLSGAAPTTLPFTCSALDLVDDWVYISGSGAVSRALADDISTTRTIGYIFSKPTSTTCLVAKEGRANGAGLTPGDLVWLSSTTPGATTTAAPTATGTFRVRLGIADTATTFVIDTEPIEENP